MKMDAPSVTTTTDEKHKTLTRKTSIFRKSFKLRSQSLNSLRLRRVFDTFDKNGDNLITVSEIHDALVALGLDANLSELGAIMAAFIKPGCDGLTYNDFVSLHDSLNDAFIDSEMDDDEVDSVDADVAGEDDEVEGDLAEAFKVFDDDGDGFISAKELQLVLCKLGMPEAKQDLDCIQQMISSVDQNRDGQVDFFEFKNMMLRSVLVP